ncbi:unnamed protein product [Adineta steineri]|uniref:DUF4460 domain-containing protein n=1 Tax=Adineta steineri TaxID=433720 RepID=A0A815K0U0_9BILA|nr:unnamed protein product [Adineta steineri]
MILTRFSFSIVHCLNNINKNILNRCYLSTDRSETISAALKKFYLKVHPDLFTQYPKEKDVNEKSLQLVSAYLSGLQRKEYMAAITVTFFTKLHECRQHLERAFHYVELTDFERNIDQLYKAIQYLDLIIDCINNAKDNILLPKKKRIDDLRRNKNTSIFTPAIPENIAFSFYIQGSKLSFAVYHTSVHGKASGYFKHYIEANVPTLADLLNQLSYMLLQLQQLRDKLRIFDEYQNGSDWKLMEEKQKQKQDSVGDLMTAF